MASNPLGDRWRDPLGRWTGALSRPVDAASLAVFRIAFGAIMAWELVEAFRLGRIAHHYAAPRLLFPYYGFGWLGRLQLPWMTALFAVLVLLALAIMVGLVYRAAAALLFFGYSYTFVLDQTHYQNHLYLFCLLALLCVFVDAHQVWSLDARREPRASVVPLWQPALIAFQVGVVYLFGGVNKLDADWLSGVPMYLHLEPLRRFAWAPAFLAEADTALLGAWLGLAIDLLAVPGLLWRRTRGWTFGALVAFHLINATIFSIGVFPWFMLAATTIFFSPDWPRRFRARFSRSAGERESSACTIALPCSGLGRRGALLLAAYVALQLGLPMRRHFYPGNAAWSNDGGYFAWTMKLNVRSGSARLFVAAPGEDFVEAPLYAFLTFKQIQHLAYTPEMIWRVNQHVKRAIPAGTRFKWITELSLNGRPPQPYTIEDGEALARHRVSLGPTRFVQPLAQPSPPDLAELTSRGQQASL